MRQRARHARIFCFVDFAARGCYDAAMKTIIAALLSLVAVGQMRAETNASETKTLVRDFYAAYKAKDATRMAEFYTPDATFVDPTFELNLKGPDQIRDLLSKALAKYESLD